MTLLKTLLSIMTVALLLIGCDTPKKPLSYHTEKLHDIAYSEGKLDIKKAKEFILRNPDRKVLYVPIREEMSLGAALVGNILFDAKITDAQRLDLYYWVIENYKDLGIEKEKVIELKKTLKREEQLELKPEGNSSIPQ